MAPVPQTACLLTFDYELFHGRNHGGADRVLFDPTARILALCDELSVPVTFFPDICCAWWHREHGREAFAERFEAQLREAAEQGHDVQLHLHPHWLWATPEGEGWRVDTRRMYAHELGWGDGPDEAPAVIRRAVEYLEQLLRPVVPDYRCVGFRAAALALQPDEGKLLRALYDAGVRLDSSITPGVYSPTGTITLDYRQVPRTANWWMSPDTGLAAADTGILEVPIATFRASRVRRLEFLVRRARALGQRRGEPIARARRQSKLASLAQLARANLRYLTGDPWFTLSCDTKGFSAPMLLEGLDSILAQHRHEGSIAISLISHPKLMFDDQLEMLRDFVVGARRRYGDRFRFTTLTQTLDEFVAARGEAADG